MRDFQRDVLAASKPAIDIPAGEFSWSLSRQTLFESCQRAYFIRHYLAQGGWNLHANELSKQAFLEKNLRPFDSWLEELFNDAIASTLQDAPDSMAEAAAARRLRASLERSLAEAEAELRFEEWRSDPKKLNLMELYYGDGEFKSYTGAITAARESLEAASEAFVASEIFPELLAVENVQWRRGGKPQSFQMDGIEVWTSSRLTWLSKGLLRSLLIHLAKPDPAISSLQASLFMLFANQRHKARGRTLLRVAFLEEGLFKAETRYPNIKEASDLIAGSSAVMLAKIRSGGTVRSCDFPPAADRDAICLKCRFRGLCKRLDNLSGG